MRVCVQIRGGRHRQSWVQEGLQDSHRLLLSSAPSFWRFRKTPSMETRPTPLHRLEGHCLSFPQNTRPRDRQRQVHEPQLY